MNTHTGKGANTLACSHIGDRVAFVLPHLQGFLIETDNLHTKAHSAVGNGGRKQIRKETGVLRWCTREYKKQDPGSFA